MQEAEKSEAETDELKRRPRRPRRGHYRPLYVPLRDAFEMVGVGSTKGYELINAGIIETVPIGRRRYATFESLARLATPADCRPHHRDDNSDAA
jgi:hypothetical protein